MMTRVGFLKRMAAGILGVGMMGDQLMRGAPELRVIEGPDLVSVGPVGGPFPPAHPNCRCTLEFVTGDVDTEALWPAYLHGEEVVMTVGGATTQFRVEGIEYSTLGGEVRQKVRGSFPMTDEIHRHLPALNAAPVSISVGHTVAPARFEELEIIRQRSDILDRVDGISTMYGGESSVVYSFGPDRRLL